MTYKFIIVSDATMQKGSTRRVAPPSGVRHAAGLALLVVAAAACAEKEAILDQRKFVQHSADEAADKTVTISKEGEFQPACVDVNAGQVVEWRNFNSTLPTNVTSLGEPAELFSPNLTEPYNLCDADDGAPSCGGELFVYWRHQFEAAGLFEYLDTNTASGGRVVRDEYYGTVTVVGLPDTASTGAVCVAGTKPDGTAQTCDDVCCVTALTCPDGMDCINQRCTQP